VKILEKFIIRGGKPLRGEVAIGGAKNAVVAILPAALLANDKCVIRNIPCISDVAMDIDIIRDIGGAVRLIDRHTLEIDPSGLRDVEVPYELARSMRASYYFLGVLLTKFRHALVSHPGGCNFGDRPMDQHIKCFNALGATCELVKGAYDMSAERLLGTQIYFDKVTVGATINAMLSSVCAEGLTILENAAREPHVVDLANFLNTMGAHIIGAGTDVIKIRGVPQSSLCGVDYTIIPDQIEAGTYMVAAAATRGDVTVTGVIPKHLESITMKLRDVGAKVIEDNEHESVRVIGSDKPYRSTSCITLPHPGFPTDMQPQFTALLTMASGVSMLSEGVFDTRFRYVDELRRLGANIKVDGKTAIITGVERLTSAPTRALDLRAGAALMIAGLCAEGVTEIEEIHHIERGYEDMEVKLRGLGADIKKINRPDKVAAANVV
jgi:UDP-N-acetylglucosamine 1-carboxyvinyltransferase